MDKSDKRQVSELKRTVWSAQLLRKGHFHWIRPDGGLTKWKMRAACADTEEDLREHLNSPEIQAALPRPNRGFVFYELPADDFII